ncbi:MAG: nucleotidyltransferase family protein [Planctomycetaceae bacterium]|jgi:molybdenum cofactor cytidylyltransferase|nr:nucleotidyltransferase family protein [Planctomycetaceae bacterium]
MPETFARLVVIVPAAGHSRRMGRPKLLLPLGERSVIQRLIDAFDHPAVVEVMVVVRPDDDELAAAVAAAGATVIRPPESPADMKASVGWGLEALQRRWQENEIDAWLLAPADHPVLDADVVESVARAWAVSRPAVLVPTHEGRRGHPTIFARRLATELPTIPENHGLNWLVALHKDEVEELELGRPEVLVDLDTPEDYRELCRRFTTPGSEPGTRQ